MPLNPVQVDNPYGLPPLDSVSLTDEERRRLGMRGSSAPQQTTEDAQLEMIRSIAENASRPGADQGALARAASAAAGAVPMSEWKPAPEPLPISKKDQVRTVLDSRERQLRALEQFASDPANPVAQDEVERIRGQIESEAQRALANSTLPSPVAMYEQLVEDESPEIYRAKHKEMLLSLPGFNEKWMASVSFDPETNEPVYPKWMEKPLEDSMAKAMGVGKDEAAEAARTAAADFQHERLKRAEPNLKDYDGDMIAFDEDHAAWENKLRAHFVRTNPEAARLLPTFAEEQGFVQPAAPVAPANGSEVRSLEEAQALLQNDGAADDTVVVGPDGARYKFLPNGSLTMISGPSQ